MSNRFPKVFVLDTVAAKHNVTGSTKPHQLTDKQVGLFAVDQFGVIGDNVGATPAATVAALQIHQNVGDNKFGTVRTQVIARDQVKAYYHKTATTAQTEKWYIGYDEVSAAKTITVDKGKYITFHIHVWSNKLAKWFNNAPGYTKNITVYTGAGSGAASAEAVADAIVAAINNTGNPSGDFATTTDLQEHVVATKVTEVGGAFGVKIETVAISPELLNPADPIKFYEVELVTLDVSFPNVPAEASAVIPITKSQAATSGNGFPAELAALEAESQGFDRVREVFENPRFMKLANYVIIAADGKKYDYLYLQYDYTHNTGAKGASTGQITEQYEVIIAAPTGTLQPVAAQLNSWLTGKFAAITL